MTAKKKPGSSDFYKYFWLSYQVMQTLVDNETTYPSLIRVFHGFDNTKDTIRRIINQQVESGDYQGGRRTLLKSTRLKKEINGKSIDFEQLANLNPWLYWKIYWTAVDHTETQFQSCFNPCTAVKNPSAIANFEQIKNGCEDGRLFIREVQAYEYDNARRFSVILYLGYIQSKHNFTIEVSLSFYSHKDEYPVFCEQIKEIVPGVSGDALEEIENSFTKPADIY